MITESRCELTPSDMEASFSDGSEKPNRLWQDELCLQPLKSYPGFSSQLCNLCIQVFRGEQEAEPKVHVELLLTLEVSAERGCGFCNLILKCFSEDSQCRTTTRLSLRYRVGYQFSYVRFESLFMQRCYIISGEHIEGKSQCRAKMQQLMKFDSIVLYSDFEPACCGQHVVRIK